MALVWKYCLQMVSDPLIFSYSHSSECDERKVWREVESSVDRSLECDRFFSLNLAAGSLTWTLHQRLGLNLTKNTIRLSLQTRFHCNNRISPFMSSHEFDWVEFFVFFPSPTMSCSRCVQLLPAPISLTPPVLMLSPPPTRPTCAQNWVKPRDITQPLSDTDKQGPRMILTLLIDRELPLKMERCIGIMGFLSSRNLWFHGGRRKSLPIRLEKGRFKKTDQAKLHILKREVLFFDQTGLEIVQVWSLVADF